MCTRLAASLVVVLALTSAGCSKSSPKTTDAPAAQQPSDRDAADPLAELDALEQDMRALGLQPRASGGADGDADSSTGDSCAGEAAATSIDEPGPEPATAPNAVADGPVGDGERESKAQRNRCEDLCGLNEAICELEVRICELSESHADETTYADACERAVDDCEVSGRACDECGA